MLRTWVSGYSKYDYTLRSYHCCKELEHSSWCTVPLMQFGPPLNYLHIPECCFPTCGPRVFCEWCMELSNDLYVFSSSVMFKWYHIEISSQTIIKWIEMYRDRGSSVSIVDMHQADSRNWLGSGSGRDFSILSSGCLEVKHLSCVVVNWPLFIVEGQEWMVLCQLFMQNMSLEMCEDDMPIYKWDIVTEVEINMQCCVSHSKHQPLFWQ
jgi:hypothetical protein